jgi:hypothetical protein
MVGSDPDPPPDFEDDIATFKQIVGSLGNPTTQPTHTQFIKKMDQILEVEIHQEFARRKSYPLLLGN